MYLTSAVSRSTERTVQMPTEPRVSISQALYYVYYILRMNCSQDSSIESAKVPWMVIFHFHNQKAIGDEGGWNRFLSSACLRASRDKSGLEGVDIVFSTSCMFEQEVVARDGVIQAVAGISATEADLETRYLGIMILLLS